MLPNIFSSHQSRIGSKHPDMLGIVKSLANLHTNEGQYDEAEKSYKRALADREAQLGTKHPDTLEAAESLANIYIKNGRYDESEQLYEQVLAGQEDQLGPKHPDTLRTVRIQQASISRRDVIMRRRN